MTVARALGGESAGAALRWGACLALVLGLHAGLALVLLRRAPRPELPFPVSDAVMLELAPAAAPAVQDAPPQPAAPLPTPEPPPVEPPSQIEPPPVEPPPAVEPLPPPEPPAIPLPNPAAALPKPPPPPPPPPVPKQPAPPRLAVRPQPPRRAQANPSLPAPQAPASGAVPAPTLPPAASAMPSPSALPGWKSELASRLQRAKRYPDTARARDEQGAAAVTFTIDRSGHVLSAKLVRSSGSPSLDEEAVEMVRRADPLPPMPSELPGSTLTLTVPVTFSLR